MPATKAGNDAEGARVVAALADLHVSQVGRRREHAWSQVVVDPGGRPERDIGHRVRALDRAEDVTHLARAEGRVDLRDLLPQLHVVALGQAARDDQTPRTSRL